MHAELYPWSLPVQANYPLSWVRGQNARRSPHECRTRNRPKVGSTTYQLFAPCAFALLLLAKIATSGEKPCAYRIYCAKGTCTNMHTRPTPFTSSSLKRLNPEDGSVMCAAALCLRRIAAAKAGSRSDQRFPRLLHAAKSSCPGSPCNWAYMASRIAQMVIAFPATLLICETLNPEPCLKTLNP